MALTFPSSPTNGQIYTDTVTGNRYIYDSTKSIWKFAANNVGMSVSSTPPSNVAPGSMWFNREIGRTFVYYDDGDSKQWIETVPATGSFDSTTVASYANAAAVLAVGSAYNTANAGFSVANAGFAKANTALQNTTGTLAGDLIITGNMGVGNSSPQARLHVGGAGGASLIIGDNSDANRGLRFDSNFSLGVTYIGTNTSAKDLIIGIDSIEKLRFVTGGHLKMASGLKILNSSGNPILQQTGSILQVVTAFDSGTSTTSAGWTNTGLTASITPTSSSSKILILVSWTGRSGSNRMGHRITRGATVVEGQLESLGVFNQPQRMFTHYLDSPASTSSQTYTLQIYQPSTAGTIQTNDAGSNVGLNPHNEITLIEIAA